MKRPHIALTLGILSLAPLFALGLAAAPSPAKDSAPQARPWLGVNMQGLDTDMRDALDISSQTEGALVTRVIAGSPAAQAGLRPMDLITGIEGHSIQSPDDVSSVIRDLQPGARISVVVWRDGADKTLSATLGSRSESDETMATPEAEDRDEDSEGENQIIIRRHHMGPGMMSLHGEGQGGYLGVLIMDLSEQLARYFGVKEGEGVLVTEVVPDGPAAKAGLEAGDVILSVNNETVGDTGDLHRQLRDQKPKESVTLRVNRHGSERTFEVTLGEALDFGEALTAPAAPHILRFRGHKDDEGDIVIPIPDLEGLKDLHWNSDSKEWREFRDDLRQEMDELKRELKDLRKQIQSGSPKSDPRRG